MISISIKNNIADTIRLLDEKYRRQIPFATAKTLTTIAKLSQKAVQVEMEQKFDRPTPFTLKSTFIKPATKQNLQAMVYIKDFSPGGKSRPLNETLAHEFGGGTRVRKRLEVSLERAGLISADEFVVPGEGAKLDRYGNMSRGQVQQVLSQLRAGPDPYAYKSDSTRSKRNVKATGGYFWSRGGKLPRGAWQRTGTGVKPILIVIKSPTYRRRIDMNAIVTKVINARFDIEFRKNLAEAIRTAR